MKRLCDNSLAFSKAQSGSCAKNSSEERADRRGETSYGREVRGDQLKEGRPAVGGCLWPRRERMVVARSGLVVGVEK